ncbi:MAG: acylneuraminate cytidylyltransferase family protein [Ktedonobacteraceae bacterium]|nr:acylneuraminate cytidylyltransferase family protein [Ktedonobacteraceae bacterium]
MSKTLFMMALRSGSKGVRDKNIRPIGGIPLFAHAAKAVLNSQAYRAGGTLLVNTDSEEYAGIARQHGAITPFIRPASMATDGSPIHDSIDYTYKFFEERGESFDLFALIQATSPFTTSTDLDKAVTTLQNETRVKAVISVTEADVPPVWCNTLNETLSMKDFLTKEIRQKNRQELPKYYRVTGAVRIARWADFKVNNYDWYFDDSKALIIDRARSLDIDSEEDFSYATYLMQRNLGQG